MSNFTPNHYSAPLTLYHEVLCHQACYVDTALGSLRVVSILEMQGSHTVQPGPSQLRRVAIRLGKTVVKVNQLLVVTLMDLKGERRQGEEKRGRGDKEERRGEEGGEKARPNYKQFQYHQQKAISGPTLFTTMQPMTILIPKTSPPPYLH